MSGLGQRDAKFAIARDAGAVQPTWRVRVKAGPETADANSTDPDGAAADLFVEFPEGWYFESKKTDNPNEFLIVEVEAPPPQIAAAASKGVVEGGAKIPVTVTLAQPRQSYEFTVDLGMFAEQPSLAHAAEPALAIAPAGEKQ